MGAQPVCVASTNFIAHLGNQQVVGVILPLQVRPPLSPNLGSRFLCFHFGLIVAGFLIFSFGFPKFGNTNVMRYSRTRSYVHCALRSVSADVFDAQICSLLLEKPTEDSVRRCHLRGVVYRPVRSTRVCIFGLHLYPGTTSARSARSPH